MTRIYDLETGSIILMGYGCRIYDMHRETKRALVHTYFEQLRDMSKTYTMIDPRAIPNTLLDYWWACFHFAYDYVDDCFSEDKGLQGFTGFDCLESALLDLVDEDLAGFTSAMTKFYWDSCKGSWGDAPIWAEYMH